MLRNLVVALGVPLGVVIALGVGGGNHSPDAETAPRSSSAANTVKQHEQHAVGVAAPQPGNIAPTESSRVLAITLAGIVDHDLAALELPADGFISGRVVDSVGKPVPGLQVQMELSGTPPTVKNSGRQVIVGDHAEYLRHRARHYQLRQKSVATQISDADGRVSFQRLLRGSYRITTDEPERFRLFDSGRPVTTVETGEEFTLVQSSLSRVTLDFFLIDGQRPNSLSVQLSPYGSGKPRSIDWTPESRTAELVPGTYYMSINGAVETPRLWIPAVAECQRVFQLGALGTLVVQLRAAPGDPLGAERAWCAVLGLAPDADPDSPLGRINPESERQIGRHSLRSAAGAKHTIEGISDGRYLVAVGRESAVEAYVVVDTAETREVDLELPLWQDELLRVTLINAEGELLDSGHFTLISADGSESHTTPEKSATGELLVPLTPKLRREVGQGLRTTIAAAGVQKTLAVDTLALHVVLPREVKCELRLIGAPPPSEEETLRVVARSIDGRHRAHADDDDEDGIYEIVTPVGKYIIEVSLGWTPLHEEEVEIFDTTQSITIRLNPIYRLDITTDSEQHFFVVSRASGQIHYGISESSFLLTEGAYIVMAADTSKFMSIALNGDRQIAYAPHPISRLRVQVGADAPPGPKDGDILLEIGTTDLRQGKEALSLGRLYEQALAAPTTWVVERNGEEVSIDVSAAFIRYLTSNARRLILMPEGN